jgi:hypothetical protein
MCDADRDSIIFWVAYIGGHFGMIVFYYSVKALKWVWRHTKPKLTGEQPK